MRPCPVISVGACLIPIGRLYHTRPVHEDEAVSRFDGRGVPRLRLALYHFSESSAFGRFFSAFNPLVVGRNYILLEFFVSELRNPLFC